MTFICVFMCYAVALQITIKLSIHWVATLKSYYKTRR